MGYLHRIQFFLRQSRTAIFIVFILYISSCSIGIVLVHNKVSFAVNYRDQIVNKALASDQSSISYNSGNTVTAALIDFASNAFLSAIPQSIGGLTIVIPFISVPYQGYIGGIVSIDGEHLSRLTSIQHILYYFIVLLLQYIPYSIVIGSGISVGIQQYKKNKNVGWDIKNYKIDKTNVINLLLIYLSCLPLFFIASLFEFLSKWN